MGKRKYARKRTFAGILLILALVVIGVGAKILAPYLENERKDPTGAEKKTITIDGVEYFPRQDVTVLMILGVDQSGNMEAGPGPRNDAQADMVMLLVLDETEKKCNILALDRDTMLDLQVSEDNDGAETVYGQLALAYTYGTGLQDSCENVKRTVSTFFLGANIDAYVAMNRDAIAAMNDTVGGVMVEVKEDFSQVDPTITKGTVTLKGEQAANFVGTTRELTDPFNLSSLERQMDYVEGFFTAFRQSNKVSANQMIKAYKAIKSYVETDCSLSLVTTLLNRFSEYTFGEIITLSGEKVLSEDGCAFYPDVSEATALALGLFYAPKN